MIRYQIHEIIAKSNHAGSKAVDDVCSIAKKMSFVEEEMTTLPNKPGLYNKVYNKIMRQKFFLRDQKNIYNDIVENSIILLQHPLQFRQIHIEEFFLKLKKKKNVKFISLVHDVYSLRMNEKDKYYENEFNLMCRIADVIIVHNDIMKQFFIDKGISEEKLVCLNIFDYLIPGFKYHAPTFSHKLIIAGNLNPNKSSYLKDIYRVNVDFELFGPNFDEQINKLKNIHYNGSLPPDEVPNAINTGFGLVWDGNSVESCTGNFGQYLKYNNPHKLSLYLASGLPVVIWKEAAEADFVKKNGIGIAVNSLYELPQIFENLSENDYSQMLENVKKISQKLRSGYYTENAITKAIKKISFKE